MNYYLIKSTENIADGFGGTARGPLIKLLPKYQNDVGLIEHEKTHVWQWYVVMAIGLLLCTLLTLIVSPFLWPLHGVSAQAIAHILAADTSAQCVLIATVNRADGIRLFETPASGAATVLGTPGMPQVDGYGRGDLFACRRTSSGERYAWAGVHTSGSLHTGALLLWRGHGGVVSSASQIVTHFAAYNRAFTEAELLAASKL